jgi:hypothetical protein
MTGKLQIPVGMTWNQSTTDGEHLSRLSEEEVKGGIVFAWHSQTWAMHMFRVSASGTTNQTSSGVMDSFHFEEGGGKQGGKRLKRILLWSSKSFSTWSRVLAHGVRPIRILMPFYSLAF